MVPHRLGSARPWCYGTLCGPARHGIRRGIPARHGIRRGIPARHGADARPPTRCGRALRIFNMSTQRVGRAAEDAKLFHIFHYLDTNESGHIDEHEMKTFIQR